MRAWHLGSKRCRDWGGGDSEYDIAPESLGEGLKRIDKRGERPRALIGCRNLKEVM